MRELIAALKQAHLSMLMTSNCIVTDDPSAQPSETSWRHDNQEESNFIASLIDVLSSDTCHECGSCKSCPLILLQERLQTVQAEHDKTCTSVKP